MSEFSVWEGIFDSFQSAQGSMKVFNDKIWIDKQKAKIESRLAISEVDCRSTLNNCRDYPLAVSIASSISCKSPLSVLDVGGGMGEQYLEVVARIPSALEKLRFTVLENKELCSSIPASLKVFSNLHFISDLEEIKTSFDLIHFGSSLQYIDDWKSFLDTILHRASPETVVISDLLAGDVPGFVTLQKYGETKIPIRMYNEREFCTYFENLGFELTYRCFYDSRVLGQEFLPNGGLPEAFRIKKPLNLIFSKIS